MDDRPTPASELEELRQERAALAREADRLREELAAARRSAARRDEAQSAENLDHEGRLAASEARTAAAEIGARAAWARAAELGGSLGRRIVEGQARLVASQAAVASLERANEGLAAGRVAVALREADLRAVIESAIDCAIVTTDRDGLVLAWNSGARRLLGWDEASAVAMDLAAVLPPEDSERGVLAADIEAALSGARVSREGRLLRQDGATVWAGIEAMALRADGVEEPAGVLWMLRDRSAARQAEERLRRVLETDAVGVLFFDRGGRLVEANDAFLRMTGWTREDLGAGALTWRRMTPAEWVADDERQMERLAATGRIGPYEKEWLLEDGSRRWMLFAGRDLGDGTTAGFCIDVTERRQAEAALRAREERLRGVLDGMGEGFGLLAPDFTILEHNREARRMDGRPREAIVGRSHWEAYPGSEDSELGRLLRHAMAARVPVSLVHRYAWEDGRARWLDMRAYPTPDGALAVFWRDVTDRRAAEEALREREERLRKVLDIETVGVVFFDLVGGIQDANDAFLALVGHTRAELEAGEVRYERLTVPEWRWRDERTIAELKATGRSGPFEKEYARRDGSRLWILCTSTMLDDRTAAEFIIDVTERKQAEAALRESEARFRGFAENSADVLWIVSGDGSRLEFLSPAFDRVFGEPRERLMADLGRFLDLVHPDDRDQVAGMLPRVLAGEAAVAHYRVVRPADGRVVHLRDTGFPIRDAVGGVVRAAGIVQDISDLHEAAAAREAEKERFRTLAEGMPQLVWRAAAGGRWAWAGPQWTAYTGLSDAASRGLGWLDAVHPEDREGVAAAWARATEAGGAFEVDCRLRCAADGAWRWFQSRGAPLREGGRVVEWIGTSTDIDDQMRAREVLARAGEELEAIVAERTAELMAAEETLRQTQKLEAIGQLTGGIAHDFNNMLQGVAGGLDMARRRMQAGRLDDAARYLDAARDATARAAGLTRRLLAFARRQRLEPRPVDPGALVRGMAEMLQRTIGPTIALELDLADGAARVVCDANELESALLNLCINARDAMPQGGRLVVLTRASVLSAADLEGASGVAPGTFVEVAVADTGSGMPPEVLERVLEPFFTTKPLGRGTGLGLSQVYGFVRQSGGALRIESTPGRGSTVRLWLPFAARGEEAGEEPGDAPGAAAPEGGGGGRDATLLLVDDETGVREPAAARLRDLGYRVVEASDGPSALRLLEDGLRPDLLVTDVGLPGGMDGARMAQAARHLLPGLPVLFMTGYATAPLPLDAEVIGKPFTLDALTGRVRSAIAAALLARG